MGPFLIIAQVNPVTYKLRLVPNMHILPSFQISFARSAEDQGYCHISCQSPPGLETWYTTVLGDLGGVRS